MGKKNQSKVKDLGYRQDEMLNAQAEKAKRAAELVIANIRKAKRSAESVIANVEKAKLSAELVIANKELVYQKNEKSKREAELIIANVEKAKRAAELVIANIEKSKRAAEFVVLAFQNREKEKLADELIIANEELSYQNEEKAKRAAELVIANIELAFQNSEKEKRADELIIANRELSYQNEEKAKRAAELVTANIELAFQNNEKEKRAGELIIANKDLKQLIQLNSDKNRFISILSHDLRSPFNNLLGLSEVLVEDIRKLNIDEIEDIVIMINKSAQSSFNLLENILNWSRTQQGKIPFDPQMLSFMEICKDAVEVLKPIAKVKNMKIDYSTGDQIFIYADIDMVKTVLRNIVSNAIKFTNNNGSISITAKLIDSKIEISVSDTGLGIPPDNLSKLFDISEVLSTKGTEGETGTGLGLLLCKEFVGKHGGEIWVESEVGKGSEFKFTLPISIDQGKGKMRLNDSLGIHKN